MSGDKFKVALNMERESKIKFAFHQDIIRMSDEKLMVKGKIIGTALNPKGRPAIPDELSKLLG